MKIHILLVTLVKHKLLFVKHVCDRAGMIIYNCWAIMSIDDNDPIRMWEVVLSKRVVFFRRFYQQVHGDLQLLQIVR